MNMEPKKAVVRDVFLGKELLTTHVAVSKEMMGQHLDHVFSNARIDAREDFIKGGLIVTLRSYLLKSLHNETRIFSIEVPATWWDHLKQALSQGSAWQQWLARRLSPPNFRIESKAFEVSVRLCPHNDTYLSDDPEVHFQFLEWKD